MYKYARVLTAITAVSVVFLAAGCSPAVQPLAPNEITGKEPFVSGAWKAIANGVAHDEAAGMYRMKMNSSVAQGPVHSSFSMYGSFNPPDRAGFSLQVNNVSEQYYQQGTSAYVQTIGGWSQAQAMTNIDVFPSYQSLVSRAEQANIAVRQLKQQYVLDEFCNVYAASLPAGWLQPLADWQQQVPQNGGSVEYFFYIGQKDGALREVTTTSVGSVQDAGPVSISTDTVFWGIGKSTSKVQFPPSLLTSMEK